MCGNLFGESSGIVQYQLSGTEGQALQLSPLKILIDYARRWATRRGATVLHLGGGVGGAQDSLMHFKSGFSDRRHLFKTWHVVLDEQRYAELSGGALRSTDFFPAYRGSKGVTSVGSARGAT